VTRGGVIVIKTLSAVTLAGLLMASAGCSFSAGGGGGIDNTKVEDEIGKKMATVVAGTDVTVDCPSDVDIEAGATFECQVNAGSQEGTFTVTQKNDQGDVSFTSDFAAIDLLRVEEEISTQLDSQLGGKFKVACETPAPDVNVEFAEPGSELSCSFSGEVDKGQTVTDVPLQITVLDTDGNIDWKTTESADEAPQDSDSDQ
jgi:hypothetical protein